MPINTKLRTPILKPRHQGGTFYTFSSALEDIGLNINERSNKVRLSYYVLLDIPKFSKSDLNVIGEYDSSSSDVSTLAGDYFFAEYFQDYIQNAETTIRNQVEYNYAANKTVSERVFWKAILKDSSLARIDDSTNYYQLDDIEPIVKAYGRISAGSQRTDSYGLYNETFVQIPSSYGQMPVFFKQYTDENYRQGHYYSTNDASSGGITLGIIEGIQNSEFVNTPDYPLNATGISAKGIFDGSTGSNPNQYYYDVSTNVSDSMEIVLDINELKTIFEKIDTEHTYNYNTLTYDDIGFGNVYGSDNFPDNFTFNAILIYYTIYNDANGVGNLSTNLYGLYILDNALEQTDDPSTNEETEYYFPSLLKTKATRDRSGTSFSFRINAKPTSAYNGDITLNDNSSEAYQMSENFNDVIRNLSDITGMLREYMGELQQISTNNTAMSVTVANAISRINELENNVNTLRTTYKLPYYPENTIDSSTISVDVANEILDKITIHEDENYNVRFNISTENVTEEAFNIINKMSITNNDITHRDLGVILSLVVRKLQQIRIQ